MIVVPILFVLSLIITVAYVLWMATDMIREAPYPATIVIAVIPIITVAVLLVTSLIILFK
jgi:hypothetical protein